ncbi:hypothetical protein HD806DRAFT_527959 [Xylariaceae sp. AK1471]|nr:hypothetical protein HD806DRAFT_527959 [Xylariaceae sp. AK1471]
MAPNRRHGYKHGLNPEFSSEQHAVTSLPATPTKKGSNSGEFDIWFLEFSNFYSLNLRRPGSCLSIEQRASPYYQESWFYDRLKDQYHQGNADIILRHFNAVAHKIHSTWVEKPMGEQDVTPSFTNLPRASSEPERTSMLDHLTTILERFSQSQHFRDSITEARSFLSPQKDPNVEEPPSPTPSNIRHSKRSSDEWSTSSPSSKRCRGVIASSRPPSVLSRLDSGEVRASTPVPELPLPLPVRDVRSRQQQAMDEPVPSVNSSKSSFVSNVFTEPEEGPSFTFPDTQETVVTVEASSQHKLGRPPPSVVDSLAPSSSTERALEASPSLRSHLQQNVTQLLMRNVPSNDSYSDFSLGSGDLDLSQYDHPVPPMNDVSPSKNRDVTATDDKNLERRLQDVWPVFPEDLQGAPLAVRWEIMRVTLFCGVSMKDLHFQYEPILNDQNRLWERLRRLKIFEGKSFPEKSRPEAWSAAMSDHFRSTDRVVILTASLALNPSKDGPLFKLSLQPLKLDLPHRLDRRFGSDRFLEIIIPSTYSRDMKKYEPAIDIIHNWLVRGVHVVVGRIWSSFYTKQALPKKIHKDDTLKPEVVTILQERIYLFAEDGNDFRRAEATQSVSPRLELSSSHTKMKRRHLLDWLLQIQQNRENQKQSVCKLFSRIALGLSRSQPTAILQPEQIRHRDADILSPTTKKVMNDGIARMSTALARQLRDIMHLDDIPAGFQGRFGSAKGFWIRDTEDTSNEIWIETYPSQRKWKCDYLDEDHRTFEVLNASKELKSATLNLQLLPILEDRAINKLEMKERVGNFMKDSLESDMKSQKDAMEDPALFKLWVHENAAPQRRQDRVRPGHIPWIAGLPTSREDQMELLLSQGFDPTKLEFLRNIAYDIRKAKCQDLQTKLNVKVGRSTYAYMTIDFLGVLEEDEVHLGFSSKFSDEQSGFSETFLHGMDLLVARTPAHYPSDIQRVKAVFKPELGSLKDVIIFSKKGDVPLADKLSGGDYDGDIAWICWEPTIVNNFTNAPLPKVPDLFASGDLTKITGTYKELARSIRLKDVTAEFIDQAFRFNMDQSLLGACTNYKEKLCYSRNSVSDGLAIYLSTLISHLVDRAKQGIVFTEKDWAQMRKTMNAQQRHAQRGKKQLDPLPPQYKNKDWGGNGSPTHIIDYVKFEIGKPTVEIELRKLNDYLSQAKKFDEDLVKFFGYFEKFKRPFDVRKKDEQAGNFKKNTWETVLEELEKSIKAVESDWNPHKPPDGFEGMLMRLHERWQNIVPTDKVNSKTVRSLCEDGLASVGLSQWDLLKASYCFKMYYNKSFPWYMAGYQLAFLKSITVSRGVSAPPVLMTPAMYAGVRPDAKFVRAVAALHDGRSVMADEELEDNERLMDQDV